MDHPLPTTPQHKNHVTILILDLEFAQKINLNDGVVMSHGRPNH